MEKEISKILDAINAYFDGTAKADVQKLKKGYIKECMIYFTNDNGHLDSLDQKQFHEVVNSMHKESGQRINQLISLDFGDGIAAAKTRADYPSFYFTDYLNLLKIGKEWKIVNKITVRKNKLPSS